MKKTIMFALLGIAALGALSVAVVSPRRAGMDERSALAAASGASARTKVALGVGYVVLPEAMRAHPLWAELLQTEQAIERNRGRLRSVPRMTDSASRGRSKAGTPGDSVGEHVKELSASLNRSRAEQGAYVAPLPSEELSSEKVLLVAHTDVAAKSSALMTRAQGLIAQAKQAGEQAYASYKASLDEEYGPKMLTLRVKRCVARSEEDLKAIDGALSRYADEKDALLRAKAAAIASAGDHYSGEVMTDARSELDRFSAERYGSAEAQLARSSAVQSAVPGAQASGKPLPELSPRDAEAAQTGSEALSAVQEGVFRARDTELRARKEHLLEALQAEVRRVSLGIAKRRGLAMALVAKRPSGVVASVDLTQDVIRASE